MDSTNQNSDYSKKPKNYHNSNKKKHYNQRRKNFNNNKTPYSNKQKYIPQPLQYINPYYAQEMIYRTEMYIYSKYRNLIDLNTKNQGLSDSLNSNSQFFVIKSFSEEDVHKSIKYGVWSSSKNGNITLNNSYKLTKEKGGNVYLFFSCNGSGRYVGLAKMKSEVDENKIFEYWTQDNKWTGLFEVEWIFIKDVPFKEFKNIIITMKDGETKPISHARDTQEVPFQFAKIMIEKIEKFQNSNTILEHFEYYDIRQENYEKNVKMINDSNLNQK